MRACTCQIFFKVTTLFIFHIQKAMWRKKGRTGQSIMARRREAADGGCNDDRASECDDVSGDEKFVVVKSLPWRSDELDKAVKVLDEKHKSTQSDQGIRQTMNRIRRGVSNRPMPISISTTLMWTVKSLE